MEKKYRKCYYLNHCFKKRFNFAQISVGVHAACLVNYPRPFIGFDNEAEENMRVNASNLDSYPASDVFTVLPVIRDF